MNSIYENETIVEYKWSSLYLTQTDIIRARSVQPLYPQAVFDDTANMAVFCNIGCIVKYSVIRKYSEPNDFWRCCI